MLKLSITYYDHKTGKYQTDQVKDNLVLQSDPDLMDTTSVQPLIINTNVIRIQTAIKVPIDILWNQAIDSAVDRILNKLEHTKISRVTSLNGLTGDIYILGGRGIALEQKDNTIGLCNTMYNTQQDKAYSISLDQTSYRQALDYIMCYQLCIYHFMNVAIHRSLTLEKTYDGSDCPYGSYLRYLSLKARWNHYVYTSWYNCSVIGGTDSISISVGLNNILEETQEGCHIRVNINFQGNDYSIWYGIFLEEASTLDTNLTANRPDAADTQETATIPSYEIYRYGGICKQLEDEYYKKRWEEIEQPEIQKEYDELAEKDDEASTDDGDDVDTTSDSWKSEKYTKAERLACRAFYPNPGSEDKTESMDPEGRSITVGTTTSGGPSYGSGDAEDPANSDSDIADNDHNKPVTEFIEVPTPENITNPNDCRWSVHGGTWGNGEIVIENITLKPGQSFKHVYSIAKHPAICGHTKRSEASATAEITIDFVMGDFSITEQYKATCHLQEPSTEPTEIGDQSYQKRYILTATEDMGKYIAPEQCVYPESSAES